jgi:hypothetical protein
VLTEEALAFALDGSTTYNYLPLATSAFNQHGLLSTVNTASDIMSELNFAGVESSTILILIYHLTSQPRSGSPSLQR